MSLKSSTVNSTAWATGGLIANQGINLFRLAIFARILTPEDFGVYAMVMVLYMFLTTAGDLGTSAAIVRREKISQVLLSTIFFTNVSFGVILTVCVFLFSPMAAEIYGEPRVAPMLSLMSFIFVVASTGYVHGALLRRDMEFKRLTLSNVVANILSSFLSLYLAWKGFGYMAFAAQVLSHSILFVIFLFCSRRWGPNMVFSKIELKSVFGFSANLTAFNFVDYAATNADKFLIGKFLGSNALGAYYLGFRLVLMPIKQGIASATNVIYSVLSKLQDKPQQFNEVLIKVVRGVSFLTAPATLFVCVTSDALILLLFGEKWASAAPIVSILAPAAFFQSILSPCGLVCLVKNRTDVLFKLSILALCILIPSVWFGMYWGVKGAALGYTISSFVVAIPSAHFTLRLANISIFQLLRAVGPSFLVATVVAITVWFCREHISAISNLPDLAELVFAFLLGLTLYALALGKTVHHEYKYFKGRKV